MRTITALTAAIVLLASCNQYEKTPSGLAYKITKGGSKETLKQGQFVKFNIEYKVPPKDSVITTTYGHVPAYLVVDTSRTNKHSFLEIITKTAPGDKIDFVMSVDTLKKLGMLEYNDVFHARDMIKGRVEILKTFADQTAAQADLQAEQEIEKKNELKDVKEYADKKGAKTVATASGALVEVENAGDAAKADSGTQARVMYKGYLMNGKVFDSNMDPKGANNQPLAVNVGTVGQQGSVIKGLDEALRLFGKGGKGKVFIPAMLAYGQNGNPPLIPAYANIVFDIEVVDVLKAAPPAPQPGPGQMPQR